MTYARIPKAWEGQTAVVLATGPSLCAEDVDACRDRARVIAVKDAIRLAPWADVLYGCGSDAGRWWPCHGPKLVWFTGARYTLDPDATRWAQLLKRGPLVGLSTDPTTLCTGRNSGYQAINLACLYGVRRILLLGFDLQPGQHGRDYFFGTHPYHRPPPPFDRFLNAFDALATAATAIGLEIINCTRRTALTVFPRRTLAEALT